MSYKNEVPHICGWRRCVNYTDPITNVIQGGFGAVGCPCDLAPGWRSVYPAGLPLPSAPVKIKGRHGSRSQRAHHRKDRWERYYDELQRILLR